jgi:hypothetical protein
MTSTMQNNALSEANWRPWPLFVLNDEFPEGEGEKIISESLEALAGAGYGGLFIHPRPGLICEYLGDRWFALIRHIISECQRLNLHPALYDENTYPSGFGGGHVPATAPATILRYVQPVVGEGRINLPLAPLSVFHWDGTSALDRISRDSVREGERWVAFVMKAMEPSAWHGGFAYVSILDAQVMPAFLESTHEKYKAKLNEAEWDALRAVFTDEPHLPAERNGSWSASLHFTPWVRHHFRQRNGYDPVERLPDLFWPGEGAAATRFDFYETLHHLLVTSWAKPYAQWAQANRLPLTGHYYEHDWPCPYATPGHVHLLKYMDWPGTDLLENFLLEGHEGGDPQNLFKTGPGREPHALYYLKQVQSVANQYAKERVICESWGAGGNDSSPADWLRIGRFLIVHGVNLLVPHFFPTTIRGTRKTDHPQFFSPHHPNFDYFRPMNEELMRLCRWAGQGKVENRVLLLDPVTTGYCCALKSDCMGMERRVGESLRPDFVALAQRSFSGLRETTTLFAQEMSERCIDFDIGDEYLMAEDASVCPKRLLFGKQSYECLVLPPGLSNFREPTLALLEAYLAAGGTLVACRPSNATVNGRSKDWASVLDAAGRVDWVSGPAGMVDLIVKKVAPRVSSNRAFPAGWAHQRRTLECGISYLLVNSGPEDWRSPVWLEKAGRFLVENPSTGERFSMDAAEDLSVPGREARIVYLDPPPDAAPSWPLSPCVTKSTTAHCTHVERSGRNRLVLDTCRSTINDVHFETELVYAANRRYWQAAGLESNGWHLVVQFKDQIFRRIRELEPKVRAKFIYSFQIPDQLPTVDWALGVEAPELWRISVNGQEVDFAGSCAWRDPHIRVISIGQFLHAGENTVALQADRFHPLHEVDQLYLFGDFGVEAAAEGFALCPPRELKLGSWKAQGLPFYDDSVLYHFRTAQNSVVRVSLPAKSWRGGVIVMESEVDKQICYGPNIETLIKTGPGGALKLRVVGLPKNVFGPFRVSDPRPKRAWSVQWFGIDIPEGPLPGARYDLLDLGLFAPPAFAESAGDGESSAKAGKTACP